MMQIVLDSKALSVNRVWQGRRFKTKDYLNYEKEISVQLPKIKTIKGDVEIDYTFVLKNFGRTDIDNLIKPLLDILVKNGIIEDDRKVIKFSALKVKGKKDGISITIKSI